MRVRDAWPLFKESGEAWIDDKASRLAAALAFYALLSMAPLLVLAVSVCGMVFGEDAARGQISAQIQGMVGADAGDAIQAMLAHAKQPGQGVLGTVIGAAVLLFGASGVFGELQDSLNTIWEVKSKPGRGVLGVIKDRLFSFGMVLAVAFVLLISLVVSAGLTALGGVLEQSLPGGASVWQVLNFVIGLAVITGLFAAIYKVVPDVTISYRDVLVGSLVTALLFTIGKSLIGLYLGKASVGSPFGAAGSLVVVVVWVYYSASVFFFGAEFTQAWAARYGSRIEPDRDAVPLSELPPPPPRALGKQAAASTSSPPERGVADGLPVR